ncbi:phosphoribosyltransferase [Paenibacillus sp. HJL G12]|uniref:Phosphoribosyltransferase n=2 Tax=Paenibacillus dendrobii TaxID=2691084 RepID=A0A7X3ILC1_9BACL|nr:phosphoribosyltransferase [Paenibacillus dendrobii]
MKSYLILDNLTVDVEITRNPFHLSRDILFQMAARINKKRSFLFVSKVLGKHIPVNPYIPLLGGAALALLLHEQEGGEVTEKLEKVMKGLQFPDQAESVYGYLKSRLLQVHEKTLFIAFAETATALGHAMYDLFEGNASFLHTTRERIVEMEPVLQFEEEHSHATAHRCYSVDGEFIKEADAIVLVDDEITTGKTALNIIRELHHTHPCAKYTIASLLDWRSEADLKRFDDTALELGVSIRCISLMSGRVEVHGEPEKKQAEALSETWSGSSPEFVCHDVSDWFDHVAYSSWNQLNEKNMSTYLSNTGRFGLRPGDCRELDRQVSQCASFLKSQRSGSNALCMGTGEFMYIPMRIAAEMGEGINYQSSTRSPIYPSSAPEYAVSNRFSFHAPEDVSVLNYFYNIPQGQYDELFVFIERQMPAGQEISFIQALESTGIPKIHLVTFNS